MEKYKILLLPPGNFHRDFFNFYIHKYKKILDKFDIVTLDLPSRTKGDKFSLRMDGNFIRTYIEKSKSKVVAIGMSTSAAGLLEALNKGKIKNLHSVSLVFAGEFIEKKKKRFIKAVLFLLERIPFGDRFFRVYLNNSFDTYRRDNTVNPRNLAHFYRNILDWKLIPHKKHRLPALLIHAKNDNIIDMQSRKKIYGFLENKKVIYLNCSHEPTDLVADLVLNSLSENLDFLE